MPSLKDRELNPALESVAANTGSIPGKSSASQQPVALEVPVTVNGARQLDSSDKREPFSESTKTVLVFDNGAVIRLSSAVAPGQLLFLTNEKTKKEVVCQVMKSKNYSNTNGYVEVQFTEPVSGFWGLRFPADHSPLGSTRSAGEPYGSAYSRGGMEANPPMVVAAKLESSSAAADRFKAELKSEGRASSRADLLAPADPSIEAVKLEANRLQEQLSTMLFAEQQSAPEDKASPVQGASSKALSETTAKLFEMAEANSLGAAPSKPTQPSQAESSTRSKVAADALPAEELKVPSWLEPLARNAANPAPTEEKTADTTAAPAPQQEAKSDRQERPVKAPPRKLKAAESPAVFGNTLLGQSASHTSVSSGGSDKRLLVATIAAIVVIAAAAATWYLRQSSASAPASQLQANVAPMQPTQAPGLSATAAAPEATAASSEQALPQAQNNSVASTPQRNTAGGTLAANAGAASASAQPSVRPALISEKVAKPNALGESSTALETRAPEASMEPEAKRSSLGRVRLAKPKVSRNRQPNGIAEPTLVEPGQQDLPADASLGAGVLGDRAPQPAAPEAPAPVGGNVKPARLISSVPPTYPPVARSQHIAGDVRIDALIDAQGRVSSMKVVSGPTQLQQAAMDALRQWKYQPATLNGNAVPMHLTVTLQFHLQ